MANEIRITSGLSINTPASGPVLIENFSDSFQADMAGRKGPSPGAISVSTAGTDVDFSELTTPAICRIKNLDGTNFVEYGIWDPDNSKFFPLGEILPGEAYVLRLSRNLMEEFGTGTGTTGPGINTLRFKADTAPVVVVVDAYEL